MAEQPEARSVQKFRIIGEEAKGYRGRCLFPGRGTQDFARNSQAGAM